MHDADPLHTALTATAQDPQAQALAARYAPILRFDANEAVSAAGRRLYDLPRRRAIALHQAADRAGRSPAGNAGDRVCDLVGLGYRPPLRARACLGLPRRAGAGDRLRGQLARRAPQHGPGWPHRHAGRARGGLLRAGQARLRPRSILVCGSTAAAPPRDHARAGRRRWRPHPRSLPRQDRAHAAGRHARPQRAGPARLRPGLGVLAQLLLRAAAAVPWPALGDWIPRRVAWLLGQLARDLDPASYRPIRIGRRGPPMGGLGNTLASLRKAAVGGVDMAGVDLHITVDGVVVAAHAPIVRDGAGGLWPVAGSTLDELRALDLGDDPAFPTLEEICTACYEERIGLYAEIADGRAIPAALAQLRRIAARALHDRRRGARRLAGRGQGAGPQRPHGHPVRLAARRCAGAGARRQRGLPLPLLGGTRGAARRAPERRLGRAGARGGPGPDRLAQRAARGRRHTRAAGPRRNLRARPPSAALPTTSAGRAGCWRSASTAATRWSTRPPRSRTRTRPRCAPP